MKRRKVLYLICIGGLLLLIPGLFSIHDMPNEERRDREPITIEPDSRMLVALTFDDGPNPLYTLQVLDILYEHQALATFFISGKQIADHVCLLEQMVSDGHELANHTYHHYDLTTLSTDEIRREIQRTQEALEQVLPFYPLQYVRPPFGRYNDRLQEASHLPIVLWDIDSRDWELRDAEAIFSIVMEKVQDGSIIVFHDDNPYTVEALKRLVPELIQSGFQPVTLTQLFERHDHVRP